MSGWKGGKQGHWGYTEAAAREKIQDIQNKGLSEVAMFNLLHMAEWWWPHLEWFIQQPVNQSGCV